MATIKEIQEITRFAMDTVDNAKGSIEQIFENNSEIVEVIIADGNLKSDVYKIYELLDIIKDSVACLTAMNISN